LPDDFPVTEERKCPSFLCSFVSTFSSDWKRHISKCPLIAWAQKWENEREVWEKQLADIHTYHQQQLAEIHTYHSHQLSEQKVAYDLQLSTIQAEKALLEKQLERAQSTVEKAINRPTNNYTQNVKITNHLADHQTYQRQTDPNRVMELMDKHFEPYFFHGQSGLAQFIVDHVIHSGDGKMIMVCTDSARKRFRFVNADSQIEEDLKAKILTKRISIPVKKVCNTVFGRINSRLEAEKTSKIDSRAGAFEVDLLEKKIDLAFKNFMSIREFDCEESGDFLNELTGLLRSGPTVEEDDADADADMKQG
jgi:hypothetical protein